LAILNKWARAYQEGPPGAIGLVTEGEEIVETNRDTGFVQLDLHPGTVCFAMTSSTDRYSINEVRMLIGGKLCQFPVSLDCTEGFPVYFIPVVSNQSQRPAFMISCEPNVSNLMVPDFPGTYVPIPTFVQFGFTKGEEDEFQIPFVVMIHYQDIFRVPVPPDP
jgi:hypothetical protein